LLISLTNYLLGSDACVRITKQLRELEASGLVNRIVYAEVPPRVEYELTKEGKSLKPILTTLKKWGATHALKLLEKRESDRKKGSR
jgi:DNA-binding HxlR family transcriptional regulator